MHCVTYNPKDYEILIGLDVDKRTFVMKIKNHSTLERTLTMPAKPSDLEHYIENYYPQKRVLCAYESGPTGFGLYDHLTSRSIDCLIVSPLTIPKAPNARVKTNRIDAENIAQHLKNGDLKPIRVPPPVYRELRQFVRSREDYAFEIRVTKQRIKSLLLAQSLQDDNPEAEKSWSHKYLSRLKTLECTPAVRQRLNRLLEDLSYYRRQELEVRRELFAFSQKQPELLKHIQLLQTIPGFGFVVATSLLGNIGDPKDLRNPREMAGFFGLAPSEYSSGQTVSRGPITHLGNRQLRSLLIQAAWVTIRYDKRLKQVYERIRSRHLPGAGSKKAIVAIARKLTLIAYRILKDQCPYRA